MMCLIKNVYDYEYIIFMTKYKMPNYGCYFLLNESQQALNRKRSLEKVCTIQWSGWRYRMYSKYHDNAHMQLWIKWEHWNIHN